MTASRPADSGKPEPEPRPQTGEVLFAESDFHALSDPLSRDTQFDDARLATRRKLGALGKQLVARAKTDGLALDSRTSIHHPRPFNGMVVRRLWTYVMRAKSEKTQLRKVLGRDLAKDLDAAYRNAYLCLAIEHDVLEVSLRIHSDAWFDGQNLTKRIAAEGRGPLLEQLNALRGFTLRMHDWKGTWELGDLGDDRLEEFLGYYEAGTHRLVVERRWPAPAGGRQPACGPEAVAEMLGEAERLFPFYRFLAWSEESSFLFSE